MCGGGGEPITYKELIPPETLEFRKKLYNLIGPLMGGQIQSYPGTLPYTQQPDPGQMAGLSTIMQMLGYGGYTWPGMPGAPASGGGSDGGNGGGGGGAGPNDNSGGYGGGDGPGSGPGGNPYKPKRPGRRNG